MHIGHLILVTGLTRGPSTLLVNVTCEDEIQARKAAYLLCWGHEDGWEDGTEVTDIISCDGTGTLV